MNGLLLQGLTAMGIGMGVVLSFLIILIASMCVMSKVVGYLNKIFPEASVAPAKSKSVTNVKEDEAIAVAIATVMARA